MRHLRSHLAALAVPVAFPALALVGCTFPPDEANAGGAGGATTATASTSSTTSSAVTSGEGSTGSGSTPVDLPKDDNFTEDSTVDDALPTTLSGPTHLSTDEGALIAITADDRLVYSTPGGLFTLKAAANAPPRKAASIAGNAYVRGRTVFNFAKIDYDKGTGALTFWTPKHGRRFAGETLLIGETSVAARGDDEQVLFLESKTPDTVDVVVSSADAEKAFRILEGVGRGNMETCAPSIGFSGETAIVGWCAPGSMQATLSRFTPGMDGAWTREDVSTSAQGGWSSDAAGTKLFYLTAQVEGVVLDLVTKEEKSIGNGVGWARMTKTGDALFFSVGDQLRKSDMSASAIPIVVDGFQQAVAWNADSSKVLYSSTVVYEQAAKQDLRWSTTDYFNPTPVTLVEDATATLGRSAMTDDANFALYLTDVGAQGGTLHLVPLAGGAGKTLPGVDTVVAGKGAKVVVTDNRSPADVFPPLVDLKVVDAATGAPTLLETGILDGRDILVRSDKTVVAYRRDGADAGIWLRPL